MRDEMYKEYIYGGESSAEADITSVQLPSLLSVVLSKVNG